MTQSIQEKPIRSSTAARNDLAEMLSQLYRDQLAREPRDQYIRDHSKPAFLNGSVRVFRFYEPYLPAQGRVLDWGCRHAPDSCLIRATAGNQLVLDGCDFMDPACYSGFYEFAGLRYAQLRNAFQLPYEETAFDAVIASGVLEHAAMDYESLKELYRVLKPGGRLILSYLPNRFSFAEWRLGRRNGGTGSDFHLRLYTRNQLRDLLLHTGFRPIALGYQTQADLLRAETVRLHLLRPVLRLFFIHKLTSCICAIAEKQSIM